MALLTQEKLNRQLEEHPEWELINETEISKTVELGNFREALEYVNQVGELAEQHDHHPDILIHEWNKVTLTLSTHSVGGLTTKDFKLAEEIDRI